jgi:hypothetical protein
MRLTTLTAVMLLTSATYAFAGAGAPVPAGTQAPDASGRPSAVLSEADCQKVWELASPGGNVEVSEDKAEPFVLNFQMVDSDNDAKIDESEFKAGCSKGWIKSADAATIKDMGGTPADPDKM